MGKGLSVAECHSLTARSVGSCQFVPRTEWEACSVQFSGRVFTCTQFCTAVSYICTFWVCLFCHTYTWEHYFATRCPFKRALVFQAVIWDCWSARFLSLGSGSPRCAVDVAGSSGTQPPWCQGSGGHEGLLLSKVSGCTECALGLSGMDPSKGYLLWKCLLGMTYLQASVQS